MSPRRILALLLPLLAAACVTPGGPGIVPAGSREAAPATATAPAPTIPVIPAATPAAQLPGATSAPLARLADAPPRPAPASTDPALSALRLMREVREALDQPARSESALALARDLTALAPAHPYSWLLLGETARRAGNLASAAAALRKASELTPDPYPLLALGATAAGAGSSLGEREWMVKAFRAEPTPANAQRLADADLRSGRLGEARSVLAAAYQANPGDPDLALNLAAVLEMGGNTAQALSVLTPGESQPTRLLLSRASLELRSGELEAASTHLDLALSREDAGADGLLLLGLLKMQRADLAGAEEQFRLVTRQHPERPEGHLHLGLALRRQGRFTDARGAYEEGLRVKESPELHLNLAVLLELYLGDKTGAQQHYRRFVEMKGPGADRVQGWIDYLAGQAGAP